MLLTEDEAKTKWCPAIRAIGETSIMHPMTNREQVIHHNNDPGAVTRCIASGCMAWRWIGERREWAHVTVTGPAAMSLPDSVSPPKDGWGGKWDRQKVGTVCTRMNGTIERTDTWFRYRDVAGGFCGLAGKP